MPYYFANVYMVHALPPSPGKAVPESFIIMGSTPFATNMGVTEADGRLDHNDVFEIAVPIQGFSSFTYIGGSVHDSFVFSNGYFYYYATNGILDGSGQVHIATISPTPVCFYPGTLIATPLGEHAVETLETGDEVLTADGRVMTINWLGRQTVSTIFADPLRVLPIRVKAGALGNGLPLRDLLVSPDHALFVEGVLANAGALVNGVTIIRERNVPQTFTYYHIETAEHALVLAEGAAAETFVDNVDRMRFDNWDERAALPYGDRIVEMSYPRAKSARQLPASLRQRLEDVACIVDVSAA